MNDLAPIVLFVYNRPKHTLKTLMSLTRNPLAAQSELTIYADGPKHDADENTFKNIMEVRKVIRKNKWCKSVEIIESPVNIGLADSIVKGISEILNEKLNIIVLEDDLLLSPGFLSYMNDALSFYKEEERIMHISGYMFPVQAKLPETFFVNLASSWGWATWSRAWKYYNSNASDIFEKLNATGRMNEFTFENTAPFLNHLKSNIEGTLNTWAIKWHATIFLNNGFCLYPNKSLVSNIGTEGSGIHSGIEPAFMNQLITDHIRVQQQPLAENESARKSVAAFYKKLYHKKNISERIFKKINLFQN